MIDKHFLKRVFTGKVKDSYGIQTAMEKSFVEGDIYLSAEGLEGDECADKRHHGGVDRALHQYPAEHYAYWRQKYDLGMGWQSAGMGENLSSEGMTEDSVCIGDRYCWGEAIIEVSQPRSPCFKLNRRWGIEDFSVHMQEISRCGWLYRVIKPGMVSVDQPLELVQRVPNAMTVKQACDYYFGTPLERSGLELLKQQERLAQSWKSKVLLRLETGEIENWNFRLLGHA
ncbi:MOSC domain-containing protein [Parashewanella tropica]|uniref:MOSC domain-containing protein n=1 Tax=Parashewanella tropica TaxID=2547970 RepID=UPI001059D596|nr:MOSC domain-containing protein [Parashewanella tropica]